MITSSICAID